MTIEQKGKLIVAIIAQLKFEYRNKLSQRDFAGQQLKVQPFDEGDTFFSLAFKSDKDLRKIARLAGV